MGTNLGGIPQEYFDAKKVSNEQTTAMQAKTIDTMPVNKPAPATNSSSDIPSTNKQNVDQMNTGNAADLQKDITLPNFKNISPSSFFELKREFLSLSESYIANFIKELNDMKAEYAIERKTDDLATFKKVDNSISSEQYSYYGYIFDRTNCVYLERITSVVMESKEYLDLFYFQVHFTYNVLRKSGQTIESDDIEKQEKGKKHKKIARLIQDLQMNESFTKLSPKDQESLKKVFTDKILFGLQVHNAEAFINGLRTLLLTYFMTKDEIFLTLYEDIKKQFWIQKNDFIDFLAKNKSFLIWIHTVLDTYKKTREEGGNQGKVLQSLGIGGIISLITRDNLSLAKFTIEEDYTKKENLVDKRRDASVKMTKENAEKVNLAYKVKTAKERFIYAISNISENIHSFSMENDGKSYEILSFIKNENSNIFDFEEVEDFLRESIQYIGAGTLFRRNPDIFYRANDILEEIKEKGIYLNDLQKYFHGDIQTRNLKNIGTGLNDIIIQLSKHTLYFYLYPIFLYSIAKKVQLSQNDFRILQDTGVLMSSNVEDFVIVSNFYRDLDTLINKEKNLGLTKLSFGSIGFHLKQWGIPLVSAGILSVLFALFFRFPLYFAALGVVYTILYIMSEFLLSYELKLARVLTGYAIFGLFFLLGGFNINYQQATTDRLTQAHTFLQTGTGTFDVEKAMVQMNTVLAPSSMKANLGEKSGSGKVSGSGGVKK